MKQLMNRFLFACAIPLLCSFSNNPAPFTIEVELYSFTDAIKRVDENGNNIENQNASAGGAGHSFLMIKNNYFTSVNIGYYSLGHGQSICMGLWEGDNNLTNGVEEPLNRNDEKGQDRSSGGSGLYEVPHTGVNYNMERVVYYTYEKITNGVYIRKTTSSSDWNEANNLIIQKNDSYNLTAYNCARFASDVWKSLFGVQLNDSFVVPLPSVLRDSIISTYPNEYQIFDGDDMQYSPFSSYYNTSTHSMVNYYQ